MGDTVINTQRMAPFLRDLTFYHNMEIEQLIKQNYFLSALKCSMEDYNYRHDIIYRFRKIYPSGSGV